LDNNAAHKKSSGGTLIQETEVREIYRHFSTNNTVQAEPSRHLNQNQDLTTTTTTTTSLTSTTNESYSQDKEPIEIQENEELSRKNKRPIVVEDNNAGDVKNAKKKRRNSSDFQIKNSVVENKGFSFHLNDKAISEAIKQYSTPEVLQILFSNQNKEQPQQLQQQQSQQQQSQQQSQQQQSNLKENSPSPFKAIDSVINNRGVSIQSKSFIQ